MPSCSTTRTMKPTRWRQAASRLVVSGWVRSWWSFEIDSEVLEQELARDARLLRCTVPLARGADVHRAARSTARIDASVEQLVEADDLTTAAVPPGTHIRRRAHQRTEHPPRHRRARPPRPTVRRQCRRRLRVSPPQRSPRWSSRSASCHLRSCSTLRSPDSARHCRQA